MPRLLLLLIDQSMPVLLDAHLQAVETLHLPLRLATRCQVHGWRGWGACQCHPVMPYGPTPAASSGKSRMCAAAVACLGYAAGIRNCSSHPLASINVPGLTHPLRVCGTTRPSSCGTFCHAGLTCPPLRVVQPAPYSCGVHPVMLPPPSTSPSSSCDATCHARCEPYRTGPLKEQINSCPLFSWSDLGVRHACLCAVWVKYTDPLSLTRRFLVPLTFAGQPKSSAFAS